MKDKKYLDSILQNIHEREAVQEVRGTGVAFTGVLALMSYWLVQGIFRNIRFAADKHYRTCVIKEGPKTTKKCRLNSKIFTAEKGLEMMNKVGPSKCKTKKDPAKCMKKLQVDKVKLQKQLQ